MKTMRPFLMGAAAFCLPFFLFAQTCPTPTGKDVGQQIIVKQGTAELGRGNNAGLVSGAPISAVNPSFTFQLNDPEITVPNNNCRDATCTECGWYKAFWIFGDGNYKKYGSDIAHMDAGSRTAAYAYKKPATYEPVMYLTERYHNDKKPDAARIRINVTGGATTPSDSPVLLNATTKRAEIDYNHELRKGYPITFVLAHLNNANASRVLFFYNALRENEKTEPAYLLDYAKTEVPAYFERAAEETDYDMLKPDFAARFNSNFFDLLGPKFGNCREYSYDEISMNQTLTTGLNEIRLFPVLNTVNFGAGKVPQTPAVLVSVILGREPVTGDAVLENLRNQVFGLFDEGENLDINATTLQVISPGDDVGPQSPEYIIGVAEQRIPVLTSHDPNNLFVTKIDTLPNGKFQVSFSLRICNEGEMTEPSPTLFFHDLASGMYGEKPELIDMPTDVTVSWRQEATGHVVNLNGFSIGGVPVDYEPKCKFVHFSIQTTAAGVARLYQEDPRALKVCVAFSGSTGGLDCSENDVLKEGDLIPPVPIPDENSDCWILFFLALIVLILIIYFWKQNQQPS